MFTSNIFIFQLEIIKKMPFNNLANKLFRNFAKRVRGGVRKFGPEMPMKEVKMSISSYENQGEYPNPVPEL